MSGLNALLLRRKSLRSGTSHPSQDATASDASGNVDAAASEEGVRTALRRGAKDNLMKNPTWADEIPGQRGRKRQGSSAPEPTTTKKKVKGSTRKDTPGKSTGKAKQSATSASKKKNLPPAVEVPAEDVHMEDAGNDTKEKDDDDEEEEVEFGDDESAESAFEVESEKSDNSAEDDEMVSPAQLLTERPQIVGQVKRRVASAGQRRETITAKAGKEISREVHKAFGTKEPDSEPEVLEIIPPKLRRPTLSHSRASSRSAVLSDDDNARSRSPSLPPTTDFEGFSDGASSGVDGAVDVKQDVPEVKKKAPVKTTARDNKYAAERPTFEAKQIKVEPKSNLKTSKDAKESTNAPQLTSLTGRIHKIERNHEYPPCTALAYPGKSTRVISKRDQSSAIELLLTKSAEYLIGLFLFDTAYPEDDVQQAQMCRDALSAAATELKQVEIKERLLTDSYYGKVLSDYIFNGVCLMRGAVKVAATQVVLAMYDLNRVPDMVEHVKSLTSFQNYIFPLSDPLDATTQITSQPYQHPAILAVLKSQFFSGTRKSHHKIYEKNFTSSIAESSEKEVPMAMLALVCVAIHSALCDYSTGTHKPTKFAANDKENSSIKVEYSANIEFVTTEIMENGPKGPAKYHTMMSQLYKEMTSSSSGQAARGRRTKLDFDGMAG